MRPMIDHGRAAAEHRVGEGVSLADGDRGEVGAVGDVADGVDRRRERSANSRRPEWRRLRRPRCRPSRGRGRSCSAAARWRRAPGRPRRRSRPTGSRRSPADVPVETLDGAAEGEADAALGVGLAERVADVLVEAAQQFVAAMQKGGLAAEPGEDAGELDRDVAAADDEDALGEALEMEDLVRGHAERAAGNARLEGRMRADGDQDEAGADAGIRSAAGAPYARPRSRRGCRRSRRRPLRDCAGRSPRAVRSRRPCCG